jgi:hypothetical protein
MEKTFIHKEKPEIEADEKYIYSIYFRNRMVSLINILTDQKKSQKFFEKMKKLSVDNKEKLKDKYVVHDYKIKDEV